MATPLLTYNIPDLLFLAGVHAAGTYDRDSITGAACIRVPSTGEWITDIAVAALLTDARFLIG